MKGTPASSPTCQIGTTWSCSIRAAERASRRNRSAASRQAATSGSIVFRAQGRPKSLVVGQVDDPHPAPAEHPLQAIRAERPGMVAAEPAGPRVRADRPGARPPDGAGRRSRQGRRMSSSRSQQSRASLEVGGDRLPLGRGEVADGEGPEAGVGRVLGHRATRRAAAAECPRQERCPDGPDVNHRNAPVGPRIVIAGRRPI